MHDCKAPELWTVGGWTDGKCCAFITVSDLFLERPKKHWWKEVIENRATVNGEASNNRLSSAASEESLSFSAHYKNFK